MQPGKTCGDCAAFSALTTECRRRAPTALPIPAAGGKVGVVGIFPQTKAESWCLDFLPSETNEGASNG